VMRGPYARRRAGTAIGVLLVPFAARQPCRHAARNSRTTVLRSKQGARPCDAKACGNINRQALLPGGGALLEVHRSAKALHAFGGTNGIGNEAFAGQGPIRLETLRHRWQGKAAAIARINAPSWCALTNKTLYNLYNPAC